MDLARYAELKAAGKVTMQPIGNQTVVISKRYDAASGTELADEILPVDVESLTKQAAELQTNLDAITLFLTDADKVIKG